MKTKATLFTILAMLCIVISGITFGSCNKLDEDRAGLNNPDNYFTYWADSKDFNYNEAAGYFNTAIKDALGTTEAIQGNNDDKVIEACDKCYEKMKERLQGKHGTVHIMKTLHPDGKQKEIKFYEF